jgi:hypothetical protein
MMAVFKEKGGDFNDAGCSLVEALEGVCEEVKAAL